MTFDVGSRLGQSDRAAHRAVNARTPAFDLDSVYGAGPVASPSPLRLRPTGRSCGSRAAACSRTCPRASDGTAIIADPRNDEHVVIAGLQCAFILFHNQAVDLARADGAADPFAQARRLTTWHYHWLILHELLPLFVGQAMVDDVLTQGPALLPAEGRRLHAGRVPGSRLPIRAQHGATVVPGEPGGRRGQPVLRRWSSTLPRPGPIRSTCAAAAARRAASSAGRRSSTSATAR